MSRNSFYDILCYYCNNPKIFTWYVFQTESKAILCNTIEAVTLDYVEISRTMNGRVEMYVIPISKICFIKTEAKVPIKDGGLESV